MGLFSFLFGLDLSKPTSAGIKARRDELHNNWLDAMKAQTACNFLAVPLYIHLSAEGTKLLSELLAKKAQASAQAQKELDDFKNLHGNW